AGGDVGLADRVEQRGLAVVDVTHNGDDGCPRQLLLIGVGLADKAFFDVRLGNALGRVAELLHDQLGGVGIDHIIDLVHGALRHQQLDDVDRPLGHTVGQFLNGNDLGNDHFAHDLVTLLDDPGLPQLFALAAPAQRSKRALALGLVEGIVDGELDALTTLLGTLDRTLGRFGTLLLGARVLFAIRFDLETARGTLAHDFRPPDRLGELAGLFGGARRRLRLRRRRLSRIALGLRLANGGRAGGGFDLGLWLFHRWRWRLQGLEAGTLALFHFGTFARGLERTTTRIDLVGGKPTGALRMHDLADHRLGRF